MTMFDLALVALGFVVGMLWQEFHFRKIKRELDDAMARLDRIERWAVLD